MRRGSGSVGESLFASPNPENGPAHAGGHTHQRRRVFVALTAGFPDSGPCAGTRASQSEALTLKLCPRPFGRGLTVAPSNHRSRKSLLRNDLPVLLLNFT